MSSVLFLQGGLQIKIKLLQKYYTVVLFTAAYTKKPKYKNTLFQNISLPFVSKQSHSDSSKIVETISNTYLKRLNISKPLRIICIDDQGKFSEEASNIINALKTCVETNKNVSPFEVMILPTFTPKSTKDAREIMESLWYLREHTVLISNSSLHAKLPCTEVIAVGGETEYHEAQGGVLDVVVTNSKPDDGNSTDSEGLLSKQDWLDRVLVQSLAPAVMSVVALGILNCLNLDGSGDYRFVILGSNINKIV